MDIKNQSIDVGYVIHFKFNFLKINKVNTVFSHSNCCISRPGYPIVLTGSHESINVKSNKNPEGIHRWANAKKKFCG
jgi:hypothetical protein